MLQLVCVSIYYLVFLESFQGAKRTSGNVARLIVTQVTGHAWRVLRLAYRCTAFDEVDSVCVNDSVIAAPDSEIVGDEFNRPFERGCHPGLPWAAEHGPITIILPVSGVRVLVPPMLLLVVSSVMHSIPLVL